MSTNVILFPTQRRGAPPQSLEEVLENVETARKEHVEFLIDEIAPAIFNRVYEEGFDLGHEDNTKITGMLVECLRAALYNAVGIDHPLMSVADQLFKVTVDNNEKEGID
jgi:hypothetical protein